MTSLQNHLKLQECQHYDCELCKFIKVVEKEEEEEVEEIFDAYMMNLSSTHTMVIDNNTVVNNGKATIVSNKNDSSNSDNYDNKGTCCLREPF